MRACGLTDKDQRIIDEAAEGGLAACPTWKRPTDGVIDCNQARKEIAALIGRQAIPLPKPKPKKGFVKRARERIGF